MVAKCCVTSCKVQSDDPDSYGVSFHKLPSRESLRTEWMQILKEHLPTVNQKHICVCSRHFERECFQYTGLCKKRMLKRGSVPTVFNDLTIVKSEEQDSETSTSLEIQTNCDRLQLDSISSMHDPIALLPTVFVKCEDDCESDEKNYEIHLTNENQVNPSERLLDNVANGNNADNEYETELQKCRANVVRLQRQNRNLIAKLGRCKKKIFDRRMKQLSLEYRDRPMPPMDLAVWHVEYTARHRRGPLASPGRLLSRVQLNFLDVYAVLGSAILLIFWIFWLLLRALFKSMFGLRIKTKTA